MNRINYLDRVRAIGMFLVYYGHFVQKLIAGSGNSAFDQWKLVYSFHMPLFFFLAGIFWKPTPAFIEVFREKLRTRILPWITFTVVLIPLWLWLDPAKFWERLLSASYLVGNPKLNIVTWFLICLFSVELLAALLAKYFRLGLFRIILYSAAFFVVGYYGFVRNNATVTGLIGFRPDIWYIDDAFIAIVFYFAGYLLKDVLFRADGRAGWFASILVMAIAGYIVLQTYDLNVDEKFWGVMMISSKYGKPLYFLLTAFAGIFFSLALGRALGFDLPPLNFVGRNTIIFLGLNGLCQHFIDRMVIDALNLGVKTHLEIFLYSSSYVIVMMLLFTPVVIGLRKWFPQLVGVAWTPSSLLPPIEEWPERGVGLAIRKTLKKYVIN